MHAPTRIPAVLSIAGSDSGGGAGIQADLKTFAVLGVYGMTAITAVTAQNTLGVQETLDIAPQLVRRQIDAAVGDIQADACKSGMLGSAAIIEVVEDANADQAIEILETRRDITAVFTDIQMPGSMDGLKLARAVRGRWPPIKIVATSGRVHVTETDLPEGGRFLPKPYGANEIAGLLRELTGGG